MPNKFKNLLAHIHKTLEGKSVVYQPIPDITALKLRGAPKGYQTAYSDVGRARALSILRDPDLHYTLYGYQQGRNILSRLKDGVKKVVIISPSHRKKCGIGEYGRYLSEMFRPIVDQVEVVRSSDQVFDLGPAFLKNALVLINHGPGLFDGLNPRLSQGESTFRLLQNLDRLQHEYGANPVFIHHSFIDSDHDLLFSKQQQIIAANIPSVSFISTAGSHFFLPVIELGVSPVETSDKAISRDRNTEVEAIGFFGFFQYGGKDFNSLFHLVTELRGRLVGSVATTNSSELENLQEILENGNISHDLGYGWITDADLIARLNDADYFYLPQNDYDHWNNSATARFVTNLPRPLFLPPHHPFIDMADGAIFATKQDLPQIVAHFRGKNNYNKAVDRVRAFRKRADMANTAQTLCTGLSERLTEVSDNLMEQQDALSVERFLELDAPAQAEFLGAFGLPADAGAGALVPHLPAVWRGVPSKQFWRKHYEIGDFIHNTLLESFHAIFMGICKRHMEFEDLSTILLQTASFKAGDMISTAFELALAVRGSIFHEPEIVFLHNGEACDWKAAILPTTLTDFIANKAARQAELAEIVGQKDCVHPPITNIMEVLVLPPDALRARPAPVDLSGLDFEYIQDPRNLAQRLNRLRESCNDLGIVLDHGLVLDALIPPPINHQVLSYVLEDFLFFEDKLFILNAVRRLLKRDPFPMEVVVFSNLLASVGSQCCLEVILKQSNGRTRITNLQSEAAQVVIPDYPQFMYNARDPLIGLVDARNAHEIQRRHDYRWWVKIEPLCAQWVAAEGAYVDVGTGLLNQAYVALGSGLPASVLFSSGGTFLDLSQAAHNFMDLPIGQIVETTIVRGRGLKPSFRDFHKFEDTGTWVKGQTGTVLVQLGDHEAPLTEGHTLTLTLALRFFASEFLGPRKLTLDVQYINPGEDTCSQLYSSYDINSDTERQIVIKCPGMLSGAVGAVRINMDKTISPFNAGISSDDRDLGALLCSICVGMTPHHQTTVIDTSRSEPLKSESKA